MAENTSIRWRDGEDYKRDRGGGESLIDRVNNDEW